MNYHYEFCVGKNRTKSVKKKVKKFVKVMLLQNPFLL